MSPFFHGLFKAEQKGLYRLNTNKHKVKIDTKLLDNALSNGW